LLIPQRIGMRTFHKPMSVISLPDRDEPCGSRGSCRDFLEIVESKEDLTRERRQRSRGMDGFLEGHRADSAPAHRCPTPDKSVKQANWRRCRIEGRNRLGLSRKAFLTPIIAKDGLDRPWMKPMSGVLGASVEEVGRRWLHAVRVSGADMR